MTRRMNGGSPCGRDLVVPTREEARADAYIFNRTALWLPGRKRLTTLRAARAMGTYCTPHSGGICHTSLIKREVLDKDIGTSDPWQAGQHVDLKNRASLWHTLPFVLCAPKRMKKSFSLFSIPSTKRIPIGWRRCAWRG